MPKPLIELNGKPFFYWSAQSVMKFVDVADISFVVLQEHIDHFEIDQKIKEYYPQARIVVIPEVLPGAVMTCLEGVKGWTAALPCSLTTATICSSAVTFMISALPVTSPPPTRRS
ncbi:MAG: hypothetical protein V8S87_00440 [Oscillospiraceae bacterium]